MFSVHVAEQCWFTMDDDHTQHQNSTTADQDEKLHPEKINQNGQSVPESNNLEAEPVDSCDTHHGSVVSVVEGKKKEKTSVPVWRLVSTWATE